MVNRIARGFAYNKKEEKMKRKPQTKTILKVMCILLVIFTTLAIIISLSPNVLADVGNNNRYEIESSSSYSSDGDSGMFYLLFHILFDLFGPIPGIIVLAILFIVYLRMKKSGKLKKLQTNIQNIKDSNSNSSIIIDNTKSVSEQIRVIDPNFSSDAFLTWTKEVFLKIQQAWTERDWKIIRPFESNELFSTHNAQLNEYIKNHKINVIEKINISNASLREFRQDGDKEVITVELTAIMRDYVIDDRTREVLESNPNRDWHMRYLMTFNRKSGVKTKTGTNQKSTTNCPNCGAPTEITSSGQCQYCDSVITTGEHDWVLSDIHSIK